MLDLVSRRGKDGMILRDMGMHWWGIVRDAIDELVVLVHGCASDELNLMGDGSREEECLTFWRFREDLRNLVNVLSETHVEEGIRFVENELGEMRVNIRNLARKVPANIPS